MKYSSCLVLAAVVLVAGLCLIPAASPEPATVERSVTKSFSAQPGGTLQLAAQGGQIQVQPAADMVVTIRARERIHAGTETNADEMLKGLNLSFAQQDNAITVRAKYEGTKPVVHSGSWPPVQVDFFITVPTGFSIDLDSGGGRVTVGDLAGSVRAHTGGGDLHLGRIGDGIDASTGGGSVRIESVESRLQASTGGGSIRAAISGAFKGGGEIQTSGGSMELTVDRTAAFDLDAITSGNKVELDGLPINVTKGGTGRDQLAGSVNGGGPLLKLRSRGGSIEVVAR